MGHTEATIVDWISEDGDRLNEFVALLGDRELDEDTLYAVREKFSQLVPACGKFWQELLLSAIAEADWGLIAKEITDRRELGADDRAWIMVDRRKS